MKRDVVIVKFSESESLVIASDNSGAIGEKQADVVVVPYDVLGYYSFRVAVMECMAAGAEPISIVLHNFCGDDAWPRLLQGVGRGQAELSLERLPITGSTESNFELTQSAVSTIVIGKRSAAVKETCIFSEGLKMAVIGRPLVGEELLEAPEKIAPLALFKSCWEHPGVNSIMPVGSKGILSALNQLRHEKKSPLTADDLLSGLDLFKSSGPATCFVILFEKAFENEIEQMCQAYFHPLTIKNSN